MYGWQQEVELLYPSVFALEKEAVIPTQRKSNREVYFEPSFGSKVAIALF